MEEYVMAIVNVTVWTFMKEMIAVSVSVFTDGVVLLTANADLVTLVSI